MRCWFWSTSASFFFFKQKTAYEILALLEFIRVLFRSLDIDMPAGPDGWAVLDRLKHHPETRHIPVHIISGVDRRQQGLKAGALAYLEKPVSKESRSEERRVGIECRTRW